MFNIYKIPYSVIAVIDLTKYFLRFYFFYSNLYQCVLISIHFSLVCKLVSILSFTTSQFAVAIFTTFGIFRKSLLFGLQEISGKTEKLCCGFFNNIFGKANSSFQHVYQRSCSFCYVLNFYFCIFKNLIDIIIVLDILSSLIGFYIFHNNNFKLSKQCLENINTNINKSHTSLCLTNNVFLFGQSVLISVSPTPSSSITSYNPVIFYFLGAILSSMFYKKDNFNIKKQLFPFLIFFSLF